MILVSKIPCGFRRDGRVLLNKGENVMTEPLSSTERAFVDAMKLAGVVSEIAEPGTPVAPVSETRTSTRVDVKAPKKPMRRRRAAR